MGWFNAMQKNFWIARNVAARSPHGPYKPLVLAVFKLFRRFRFGQSPTAR